MRMLGRPVWVVRRYFENQVASSLRRKSTEGTPWKPRNLEKRFQENIHGKSPRRAVLYIPGNDERKIQKLSSLKVDCAVLDCEDGVAINRKKEARETIRKNLPNVLATTLSEVCVRVNSASSQLMEDDVDAIFGEKLLPHGVMLPKVEKWGEIESFFKLVNPILKTRPNRNLMSLIIFIETALGLVNLREIVESTIAFSASSKLQFEGLVFGSDDFCASIGVERSTESAELLYARQKVVAHAKAYGLQAIDMVHIDYKDEEGLMKQSLQGAKMGFTGKQVIHPGQIETVERCFSPSEDKIKWAQDLISAFNEHQALGKGAFTFHGKMIDMPLLKQAQGIANLAKLKND